MIARPICARSSKHSAGRSKKKKTAGQPSLSDDSRWRDILTTKIHRPRRRLGKSRHLNAHAQAGPTIGLRPRALLMKMPSGNVKKLDRRQDQSLRTSELRSSIGLPEREIARPVILQIQSQEPKGDMRFFGLYRLSGNLSMRFFNKKLSNFAPLRTRYAKLARISSQRSNWSRLKIPSH